jgi:NADH-quinone oxidoreductase subunit E
MATAAANDVLSRVEEVLARHGNARGELVAILQDVQDAAGYVPVGALDRIAEHLNTPVSSVLGVVTFYSRFRLSEQGRHTVRVCEGTACHVRGGARLLQAIRDRFGIRPGETTPDGRFSLERVACLGCCALAPAMVVDDRAYGNVTPQQAVEILEKLS